MEFYELFDADTIRKWNLEVTLDKTELEDKSQNYQDLIDQETAEKEILIQKMPYTTVAAYDAALTAQKEEIDKLIKYYDYNTTSTAFTRLTGDYVTPVAIHSVCGEEGANVAENSIDGNVANFWQHDTNHKHSIIFDLGADYAGINGIGIVLGPSDGDEFKLENVDIYISENPNDSYQQIGSGLDFQTNNDWNQTALTPGAGRYIKLESDTLDTANIQKIREVRFTHQFAFA